MDAKMASKAQLRLDVARFASRACYAWCPYGCYAAAGEEDYFKAAAGGGEVVDGIIWLSRFHDQPN
jgi:hypothetical protein